METDEVERLVDRHIVALMEHFDTVQILCTKDEKDGTLNVARGGGNIFARYGHAQVWIAREKRCMLEFLKDDQDE